MKQGLRKPGQAAFRQCEEAVLPPKPLYVLAIDRLRFRQAHLAVDSPLKQVTEAFAEEKGGADPFAR